jgi:hypothetical protein
VAQRAPPGRMAHRYQSRSGEQATVGDRRVMSRPPHSFPRTIRPRRYKPFS